MECEKFSCPQGRLPEFKVKLVGETCEVAEKKWKKNLNKSLLTLEEDNNKGTISFPLL